MIRFLPSYVGSKKYWVDLLTEYRGHHFVELFCGSAVLSANLAKTAILVDSDPVIANILTNFDKLIVPSIFTHEDYEIFKKYPDWWRWVYCLQAMSFSGVFRYSASGYNVPMKRDHKRSGAPSKESVSVRTDYTEALARWKQLAPTVINSTYLAIQPNSLAGKVVVLDPPYENSKASYNCNFNYNIYWNFVEELTKVPGITLLVFDRQNNLKCRNIPIVGVRKMRVNGAKAGDVEALSIFEKGNWRIEELKVSFTKTQTSSVENVPLSESKEISPQPLKKRGRPRGSKNKPKLEEVQT